MQTLSGRELEQWTAEQLNEQNPDIPTILITSPYITRMMGELVGKQVIELGCGNGRWLRLFQRLGATCVGVDTPQQIRAARAQSRGTAIRYYKADITQTLRTKGTADIVFMDKVLSGISNQEQLDRVVGNARTLLDEGQGRLIVNDTHPFSLIDRPAGMREPSEYSYFDNALPVHQAGFHRSFTALGEILTDHGFRVTRLEEPHPGYEALAKYSGSDIPNILRYHNTYPTTLLIEATPKIKPPGVLES